MITQDKVKVIAKYDGWELKGEPEFVPPYKIWIKQLPQGEKMIPHISPSGKEYDDWAKELKYLTSLDWLHQQRHIYSKNAVWEQGYYI